MEGGLHNCQVGANPTTVARIKVKIAKWNVDSEEKSSVWHSEWGPVVRHPKNANGSSRR